MYIFYIYYEIILLFDCNMFLYIIRKFFLSFISDIVIYLVYVDLMHKHCQLINIDVGVDEDFFHVYIASVNTLGAERILKSYANPCLGFA